MTTAAEIPIQNFVVPRGNDELVTCIIAAGALETLIGSTIVWRCYSMVLGTPKDLLIVKVSDGHGITILESPPLTFDLMIGRADTAELPLGNYYHEAEVIDEVNNHATVFNGVMTLTTTGDTL